MAYEPVMARLVLGLVVCLAVAVFAAENNSPTVIRFVGLQSPPVYLAVIVLGSAVLGALAVFLIGGLQVLRLRRRIADLERGRSGPGPSPGPSPSPGLSPSSVPVPAGGPGPGAQGDGEPGADVPGDPRQ